MKLHAMYWSATGTTRKVVREIANVLSAHMGGKVTVHDFTPPEAREAAYSFGKDDLVVFGTPVYAGRVPNVLLPFLKTIAGGGALAVPVVLFGNRNFDDGLIELCGLLEADGFQTPEAPFMFNWIPTQEYLDQVREKVRAVVRAQREA